MRPAKPRQLVSESGMPETLWWADEEVDDDLDSEDEQSERSGEDWNGIHVQDGGNEKDKGKVCCLCCFWMRLSSLECRERLLSGC